MLKLNVRWVEDLRPRSTPTKRSIVLSHMKIGFRMAGAFAAVLLFMLALTVIGIQGMAGIQGL